MNHVRDALDGAASALTDWTIGPDAMRWQPEEDRVEAPRVELVPDGFGGRALDLSAFVAAVSWRPAPPPPEVVAAISASAADFEAAVRRLNEVLSQSFTELAALVWCRFGLTNRRTECRRRTAMHADYDRRRRARRRRNRR